MELDHEDILRQSREHIDVWTRTRYDGPSIEGLVVNADGVALFPGEVEDDPVKVRILQEFHKQLYGNEE